ncbi:MAG: JDVT-CTERM system glutamic-type intramembrane protease [Candidatus Desulfacyla sp.]
MNPLRRPFVSCGMVALLGCLSNQVHPLFSVFFLASCLVLPWLGKNADHGRLMERLVLRRDGWLLSLTLACLYALGPFLFLLAVMQWFFQALFLNPGLEIFIQLIGKGMIAFLPIAVAEEFFFRGYLQETVFFSRWGDQRIGPFRYRNLAASGLFALTHVLSLLSPIKVFTFVAGMILGRVVIQSRSNIWPAVALHAFANAANEWLLVLYRMNLPWI